MSLNFIFVKVDNITHNNCEVYYKKPINTNFHKATVFNDNYYYYYNYNNISLGEDDLDLCRPIGKFQCMSKVNIGCPYGDIDYDVYVFEKDKIFCDKEKLIYCRGIPDSDENMVLIKDTLYHDYPMYYKHGI
jgi:hypothetical protein